MSEPESDITALPKCPYCGDIYDEPREIKDGETIECDCGATYSVTVYDVQYSTEGVTPSPGGEE